MFQTIRTPDERFVDLPDFSFAPHYIENLPSTPGVRIHYLDEGPSESKEVFLCLHGEPTWAYLYRKMIPVFSSRGFRSVAPDFIGFGKSDKFVKKKDYSFDRHRTMLIEFIESLDLKNITLVCQDWGGVLGLTIPMEMPERFSRLIVMNTALATGKIGFHLPFIAWRLYAKFHPNLDVGKIMKTSERFLSPEEVAAYEAPFPDRRYKIGAHIFPSLVPIFKNSPGAAISRKAKEWWKNEWNGQSYMAIGKHDVVIGEKLMRPLGRTIRNCPEPLVLKAGHFVQENGQIVAEKALEHFGLK